MALTEADDMIPAAGEAPRVPSGPEQMFRCEFLACTLRGAVCVQRQTQEVTARHHGAKARKAFQYQHCASGKCRQGDRVREAIGHLVQTAPTLKYQSGGNHVRSDASTPGVRPPPQGSVLTVEEAGAIVHQERTNTRGRYAIDERAWLAAAIPTPPHPETPVPAIPNRPTCAHPGCKAKLNANNSTGFCGEHKSATARAAAPARPAPVKPAAKQAALAITADPSLPAPASLPSSYLVACVAELKRRASEMYQAARSIGFDPAEPDATPPL